ncbi:MAG TPA: hypothetical protein VLM79_32895 [Kofleriaceae bacterium]|nr:hypothetical protein [Kofleriaceae bacterium]
MIALVASPVTVCVGLFQKAAVGFASVGSVCADGCPRLDEQLAAANQLVYGGAIGGAVLMIGGIAGRYATRRDRRPDGDGEATPELPRARVARRNARSARVS